MDDRKIYNPDKTVLEAARERIAWAFDEFEKLYVSFSGGKDSTVMLHLVMDEAIKRDRTIDASRFSDSSARIPMNAPVVFPSLYQRPHSTMNSSNSMPGTNQS